MGHLTPQLAELGFNPGDDIGEPQRPARGAGHRRGGEHGVADLPTDQVGRRRQSVQLGPGERVRPSQVRTQRSRRSSGPGAANSTTASSRRENAESNRLRLLLVSSVIPSNDSIRWSR